MTSPEVALSSRETVAPASPGCGCTMPCVQRRHSDSAEPEMELPYPEYEPRALWMLDQTTRPRSWCLVLISWPYPFCIHLCLCGVDLDSGTIVGNDTRKILQVCNGHSGTKPAASQDDWGPCTYWYSGPFARL